MGEHTGFSSTLREEEHLYLELRTAEDSDLPVFVSGNFNNWQANDQRYRMQKAGSGEYRFEFKDIKTLPRPLIYKYLRGGWETVELDEQGNEVNNRQVDPKTGRKVDFVPRWKQSEQNYDPALLPQIRIISEVFEIPQLIKTRRISALLPHDYGDTEKNYPVLYLQDGQNLFDDHAPFGNWALDKKLALMAEQGLGDIIIIAIDHAHEERIVEFTPSYKTRLGRGDGKKYVRFLADTLKPFVDRHFRTLPDREHTGIGGSSMGGLISIYAGLMYPEVYGNLMVFSPSLWVAPNIHFQAMDLDEAHDTRIYLYAGAEESANMVPNVRKLKTALERQGVGAKVEFKLAIDPNGKHNESRWGEEFPHAVEWLFFNRVK